MHADPNAAHSEETSSDAVLIAELRTKCSPERVQKIYRILLVRHWRTIMALARSRLRNTNDAEEVAQETFIRAFRSLGKLERPERFPVWLARIARNLITDQVRRRASAKQAEPVDAATLEGLEASRSIQMSGTSEPDAAAQAERDEEVSLMLEALGDLPDPYREVVVLRYLEGLSGAEIARLLGEPEGTIRNRLFRALRKLRARCEKRGLVYP